MSHPDTIPSVTAVKHLGNFVLRLEFDDGLVRELDFSGRLSGQVFEPLSDPEYFGRVRVDEELGTIIWPNGADLDPVVLHGDEDPVGGPPFRVVRQAERSAP